MAANSSQVCLAVTGVTGYNPNDSPVSGTVVLTQVIFYCSTTGGDREPPSHGLIKWWQENPKPKKPKIKPITEEQEQVDTVQEVALQQIQQSLPQVNILQAAVSSAGLSAVMMQPAVSSGMPALTTVNTSQLAQPQLLPTVTFTNGAIQVQAAPIQVSIHARAVRCVGKLHVAIFPSHSTYQW